MRKAKLGGKYTAPVGQSGDQDAGEVEEEVRGDVREEVRENKRDQSGGNQRKNMTSVVKRLEPTVAAENGTIKTSAGFMLVDQSDQQGPTSTRGYSTTRFSNHYSYPTRKILLLDRVVE